MYICSVTNNNLIMEGAKVIEAFWNLANKAETNVITKEQVGLSIHITHPTFTASIKVRDYMQQQYNNTYARRYYFNCDITHMSTGYNYDYNFDYGQNIENSWELYKEQKEKIKSFIQQVKDEKQKKREEIFTQLLN